MVAILNLIWVPVVAFAGIAIPDKILTMPILATFVVSLVAFRGALSLRVSIPPRQMLGAIFAAMSVQWTVARAVGVGIWTQGSLPFMRTAKGGATRKGPDFPAFWEAVLARCCSSARSCRGATNYKQIHEIYIFAVVLVRAEPAVPVGGRHRWRSRARRFNEFAYWRGLEAKLSGCAAALGSRRRAAGAVARRRSSVETATIAAGAPVIPARDGASHRIRWKTDENVAGPITVTLRVVTPSRRHRRLHQPAPSRTSRAGSPSSLKS